MSDEKGIMAEIYTRGIHFGKPGPCRLVNQSINKLFWFFFFDYFKLSKDRKKEKIRK